MAMKFQVLAGLVSSVLSIVPPLSTAGNQIVDSTNTPVHLHCSAWSGAHMQDFLTFGLEFQSVEYLVSLIKKANFNCIRLEFSAQMIRDNPVVNAALLKPNPSLIGKTAIDIYQHIVSVLSANEIMVILDYHMMDAEWCCVPDDDNGLWYNERWTEESVMQQLGTLVQLNAKNPWVIGVDLRNEIRPALYYFDLFGKKVLNPFKTQYPTWGTGLKTDWKAASERFGNMVLSYDPNALIFIQGLFVLDTTMITSILSGTADLQHLRCPQNLQGVFLQPVSLNVPNKVVYSVHSYEWFYNFKDWSNTTYEQWRDAVNTDWGYLLKDHPVWLGEFGTNVYNQDGNVWWGFLLRYIKETKVHWSVWELAGIEQRATGETNSYGVFNPSYSDFASQSYVQTLQALIKEISEKEFEKFIDSIVSNSQASFGVVNLSQFNLNRFYKEKTLLEYCFLYKRDVIASLLLRGGADPSISIHNPNGFNILDKMWKKLPAYAAWTIMLILFLRTTTKENSCVKCNCVKECFTIPSCGDYMCEKCFWDIFSTNDTFNDMECQCGVTIDYRPPKDLTAALGRSPELIYKQSLELYLKLDTKLNKQNMLKKPVFKALKMAELNKMYLGTIRSQRDSEILKAATIGNEGKIMALIEAGVDLNVRNEYGQTPLFIATWKGHKKVVDILIRSGANENIPEYSGVLPKKSISVCQVHNNINNGTVTRLLQNNPNHIGAKGKGSFYLDGFFSTDFIESMTQMFNKLPVAPAQKKSCSNRSYYCDTLKKVEQHFAFAVQCAGISNKITAMPQMRYLDYSFQGGWLPAHIDLSRTEGNKRSTHTFILYLTGCEFGGETAVLESIPKPGTEGRLLELVKPVKGRLFCFPHECPHEGRATVSVPKLLLRGEMLFED
ncbi:hypothetical protein HDV06_006083 [Boothiomyces sp. JEL0866]|nr:hypothetical protein HDV06_006033 [Boothiomyces sp. JEL0866]KAJ3324825.1 hypothetical protein HDV06_006083 [Boothiomyces sp. JEL0866]